MLHTVTETRNAAFLRSLLMIGSLGPMLFQVRTFLLKVIGS